MKKAEVIEQGMTVIEPNGDCFLIMHPDGSVEGAPSRTCAEHKAKRWYQTNLGSGSKIGVGRIEWR